MIIKPQAALFIVLISASLFVGGCSSFKSGKEKLVNKCSEPANVYSAGSSVKGKPISYTKLGSGSNVTLLFASIHGSERAGTPLLNHFKNYLMENCELLDGKTVIIIPVVNPDGFTKKTRHNANNIDLNRNFPAANRENNRTNGSFALSEIESYELYKIINIYKPSKILAFHEALNCIDYDGPAEDIAKRLADKCKLPLEKLGARPGSLGSYIGLELNMPIITVEMAKEDSKASEAQLWGDYKDMLIEAIAY
ncbi:MAG: DUF2817 domain-containing protein [Planctomycetaceae bacterium]|nr:DUF2817 domain-containing protein [Planctomycetaceae bacterium]